MFRKSLLTLSALALFAQPAFAADFNEASTAVWLARTESLVNAVGSDDVTVDNIGSRLKGACKGLTGDIVKYGGHMPDWAKQGQQYFCAAGDDIAARYKNKIICKDLKLAQKALRKADPAKDPQAVADAAGVLLEVTNVMIEGISEADRSC
ncbi:hypothetical protein ABAC460_16050 [Asticcacaulis sp. AC460]|uniref:hypothetical protein n=1 Tax=Asticcacaulis sp. AC460 TaxID=1282360 RepID=UPI0003C3F78C|nr:hypothetical protein [Asticcacaulis sp. AC460]ESQ88172.1 hypothetical protein ABAC460_16050 [Asticcacaulis sp. AC460]